MSDARQAILDRIGSALGPPRSNSSSEWEKIDRPYIRTDSLSPAAILELFEHRLLDYGAHGFLNPPMKICRKQLHAF